MGKPKSWVQGPALRVLLVGHLTPAGGLSRVTEVARTVHPAQHELRRGGEIWVHCGRASSQPQTFAL